MKGTVSYSLEALVSSPLQIPLQPRLGACYVGSLICNFRPTETPFGCEFGAKVDYNPNGTLLFSLLKQLRGSGCLLLRSLSSAYLGGCRELLRLETLSLRRRAHPHAQH
jgi:hypothetical protein